MKTPFICGGVRSIVRALGVIIGLSGGLMGCDDSDPEASPEHAGLHQDGGADGSADGGEDQGAFEHAYAAASVVFSDEGETSYVSVLPNLETQHVDLANAREIAGWAGVWTNSGKLYISDGESPVMYRHDIDKSGNYSDEGKISFANYGLEYAESAFVEDHKAYAFADEVIVWDPGAMEVTGTFPLPDIEDREGMEWGRLSSGRAFVARDKRAYVATSWSNWDEFAVSEDSLIVVLDTENDTVVKTIPAPCPYLDVATVSDDGYVYFSNWIYSVGPTLLQGKRKACAVRIAPGTDELDEDWSLTFADVTGGREGGVLRYAGDNKAIFVAFHDERVDDLESYDNPAELADLPNWGFWIIDLETLEASPIAELGWSVGGYYSSFVDDRLFVLVPSEDWTSTGFYEVLTDGDAKLRWTMDGWSLGLNKIR